MAGLLDRPSTDTPPEAEQAAEQQAPEAPQAEAPARACATCSAPLADGQDWCLECGSAQPGRLGGRPGWRAALTVLGITGILVGGAGAAAYAALSSDAQRDARAAAPPAATPQTQAPPVVQAPPPTVETPPAEDTPSVEAPDTEDPTVPAPSDDAGDDAFSDPGPAPAPAPAPAPTPAPSGSSGSSGSGTPGGTGSDTTTETAPAEPVAIELKRDAAALYDPFSRAADSPGKPAHAVDGKEDTAFELPVAPDGTVRAGLTVSLPKAQTLKHLVFTAGTPGFTVEIYATKHPKIPPDVLDARWEHVANRRDADVEEKVKLDGRYRHVLLWFTEQPADSKILIPEVQLFD
jgi:hypothetical protein